MRKGVYCVHCLNKCYLKLENNQHSKIIRGLEQSVIFTGLHGSVLKHIAQKSLYRTYKKKEIIVREGEPSDSLFLIVNGIVEVKRVVSTGPDQILAYLLPGNTFGEVGILENKPRSATVAALSDVELLVFSHADFMEILNRYPKVTISLAKLLGHYLTDTNKRLSRGNKERNVVLVFDQFQIGGTWQLAWSFAKKLQQNKDEKTIFFEYPHSQNMLKNFQINGQNQIMHFAGQHREILKHSSGVDLFVARAKHQEHDYAKLSLLVDNLLNNYENIVFYLNEDLEENIGLILEHTDQIILVGSNNKDHWKKITAKHRLIKNELKDKNVKIFTVLIQPDQNTIDMADLPRPDFEVIFSSETTNYQLNTEESAIEKHFYQVVETCIDRLQRNNHLGIFIPTTYEINKSFDTTPYIDKTLSFLGERFGGATSEEARGIWNSNEIGLVGEKLYKVHTYANTSDLKKFLDEVVEYVKAMKKELKQEAMAMEINQKLTLI